MAEEKRKHPRIGSHNLVSYVCRDEHEQIVIQGMGRAVNVSEGGILLETGDPFDPSCTISLTLALEDELMEVTGKVVFARKSRDGKMETGIQFLQPGEKNVRLLRQFMTIYRGDSDDCG